jgi:hypothetical protein
LHRRDLIDGPFSEEIAGPGLDDLVGQVPRVGLLDQVIIVRFDLGSGRGVRNAWRFGA